MSRKNHNYNCICWDCIKMISKETKLSNNKVKKLFKQFKAGMGTLLAADNIHNAVRKYAKIIKNI